MVNGLVPPYHSAIVPCNFENIHDYNTRQAVSIPPVRTRTTLYTNYFLLYCKIMEQRTHINKR